MSIFSDRIKMIMKQQGLTQKEAAEKAGVSESAMSHYVNGERTPHSEVLTRIAKALNTSTDILLGNDELNYLQRNLGKLDKEQMKLATRLLKAAFNDIFDDDNGE